MLVGFYKNLPFTEISDDRLKKITFQNCPKMIRFWTILNFQNCLIKTYIKLSAIQGVHFKQIIFSTPPLEIPSKKSRKFQNNFFAINLFVTHRF